MANDHIGQTDLFGQTQPLAQQHQKLNGGSSPTTDSNISARYAEFMVCAYLSRLGYNAIHVDKAGYDVILDYEHASYRIDVKSSSVIQAKARSQTAVWRIKKKSWLYHLDEDERKRRRHEHAITPDHADLLALFHMSFDSVVFQAITRLLYGSIGLPVSQVKSSGYGEASLHDAIRALKGRHTSRIENRAAGGIARL